MLSNSNIVWDAVTVPCIDIQSSHENHWSSDVRVWQAPMRRRAAPPPPTAFAMWATLALLEVHAQCARQARTRHIRAQELASAAPQVWVPKTQIPNLKSTQCWILTCVNLARFKLDVLSNSNIVWDAVTMPCIDDIQSSHLESRIIGHLTSQAGRCQSRLRTSPHIILHA